MRGTRTGLSLQLMSEEGCAVRKKNKRKKWEVLENRIKGESGEGETRESVPRIQRRLTAPGRKQAANNGVVGIHATLRRRRRSGKKPFTIETNLPRKSFTNKSSWKKEGGENKENQMNRSEKARKGASRRMGR